MLAMHPLFASGSSSAVTSCAVTALNHAGGENSSTYGNTKRNTKRKRTSAGEFEHKRETSTDDAAFSNTTTAGLRMISD